MRFLPLTEIVFSEMLIKHSLGFKAFLANGALKWLPVCVGKEMSSDVIQEQEAASAHFAVVHEYCIRFDVGMLFLRWGSRWRGDMWLIFHSRHIKIHTFLYSFIYDSLSTVARFAVFTTRINEAFSRKVQYGRSQRGAWTILDRRRVLRAG